MNNRFFDLNITPEEGTGEDLFYKKLDCLKSMEEMIEYDDEILISVKKQKGIDKLIDLIKMKLNIN